MLLVRSVAAMVVFSAVAFGASPDVSQTFTLLREGERLSTEKAAELEKKLAKKANDLEDRLRLLSYYAGQDGSGDAKGIKEARLRHVLWIIEHEPDAAIFGVASRVYAIQLAGGLADPDGFQKAKEAWQAQISAHPTSSDIKRNAATFFEIQDPELEESLLKSTGDDRWLGQVYAKAILGIVALDYRTGYPALTSDERRSSKVAHDALAELENSDDAALLGGAGFTLCRDGGMLYADGKLNWDYVPLATKLLTKAGQIDPSNKDAFSTVPQLPKRGERPTATVRIGSAQLMKILLKHTAPVRPAGALQTSEPVSLNVLVGLDGSVVRTAVISGPAQLRSAASEAVKQWVFVPTTINGKPVYVLSTIELSF